MPTRGTSSSRASSSFAIPRKHRVSLIGKFRIAFNHVTAADDQDGFEYVSTADCGVPY
jgi:hypothetical protein